MSIEKFVKKYNTALNFIFYSVLFEISDMLNRYYTVYNTLKYNRANISAVITDQGDTILNNIDFIYKNKKYLPIILYFIKSLNNKRINSYEEKDIDNFIKENIKKENKEVEEMNIRTIDENYNIILTEEELFNRLKTIEKAGYFFNKKEQLDIMTLFIRHLIETFDKNNVLNIFVYVDKNRQTIGKIKDNREQLKNIILYNTDFIEKVDEKCGKDKSPLYAGNDLLYKTKEAMSVLRHPCKICANTPNARHTRFGFCPHI